MTDTEWFVFYCPLFLAAFFSGNHLLANQWYGWSHEETYVSYLYIALISLLTFGLFYITGVLCAVGVLVVGMCVEEGACRCHTCPIHGTTWDIECWACEEYRCELAKEPGATNQRNLL